MGWTYVRQPVGADRDADGLGSDSRWEDLARHDPVHTTNAEREVGDVDPDERSSGPSRIAVRLPGVLVDSV